MAQSIVALGVDKVNWGTNARRLRPRFGLYGVMRNRGEKSNLPLAAECPVTALWRHRLPGTERLI